MKTNYEIFSSLLLFKGRGIGKFNLIFHIHFRWPDHETSRQSQNAKYLIIVQFQVSCGGSSGQNKNIFEYL